MEKQPKKRGPKKIPADEKKVQVYFMVKKKYGLAFDKEVNKLIIDKYSD